MKRFAIILILSGACIDPYNPPEIGQGGAVLVIDGFINVQGESIITLSRSQSLSDNNSPQPETGAAVWVESETGTNIFLTESILGKYILPQQSFQESNYRLRIQTDNFNEYVSEYEAVKLSPKIDSVTWSLTSDLGVQINVSTHDFENREGYYRWVFDETWLYTSAFPSAYIYNYETKKIDLRPKNIWYCYRIDKNNNILIKSTTRSSDNVVTRFPLKKINQNSERMRYKYSILVTQYSITKEAFDYWKQLKKTTEEIGTLFGPLPSQLTGNFSSIQNPKELVIGFFSIGSVAENRIFIESKELVAAAQYDTPYRNCELFSLLLPDVPDDIGTLIVSDILSPNGPNIIGYTYAAEQCVDCRLTGGTLTKPDFWE